MAMSSCIHIFVTYVGCAQQITVATPIILNVLHGQK